jgi:aminoglycoside phosphotransferase (APT) family kinase protein
MHYGAFHQVAVSGDVVARVASGKDHKQRVGCEALALQQTAAMDLPFDMPRLLSGPITIAGGSGILTTRVFGQQIEAARWSAVCDAFRTAIDALHQVPARRGAGLPSPRTWCGGRTWPDLVEGRLASHLPIDAARRAVVVVSDVLEAEQASPPTLVHGDFGLHNLFWESGRVSGVIDFDHACWGDPAIDIAPLIGMFGAGQVGELVDRAVVQRAMMHRASLPLQVAAAAELTGDSKLRDHALHNFSKRLEERTLHDPYGISLP